ncbi:hypothetical protein D3C72_952470 [compost metagenome]
MHHFLQAIQHGFHRVAHTQGFAGGIGQRQRRGIQRRGVEVLRLQAGIQLGLIADHAFAEPRHWPGERHHRQTAHQVVEDVEVDHQLSFRQRQVIHQIRQRMNKRQDYQAAHQLKEQTPQRHATGRSICAAIVEHRQQTRAEVRADHQAQRHREGDRPCGGQRGGQQHGRQTGVTDDGKHRANQRVEHDVARQRGENHLHTVSLGDRRNRLHNQLQRQ